MNYTDELTAELERVTLKGNADKLTINRLAAIIWDVDQRLKKLEAGEEPVAEVKEEPKAEEPVEETSASPRRVGANGSTKKASAAKKEA